MEIIKNIPLLFWPLVVLIITLLFKKDIKSIFSRLKSGTFLGNEIHLQEEVDKLAKNVEAQGIESKEVSKREEQPVPIIVDENQIARLVYLSATIEKELKKLLYVTGWFNSTRIGSIKSTINSLISMGVLPANQKSNVDVFMDIRNKIVHGTESVSVDIINQVIDVGYTILNQIQSIPTEHHYIEKIHVPLFSDEYCKNPTEKGFGIILKSISPGNTKINYQIFPTLKNYEYTGIEVTWEWNMGDIWQECYYRDPNTNEIKQAWGSSAEFIGRDVCSL